MRFWILLLTLVVTVTAIFESSDLMEGVTFNPLGHFIEPKLVSEHDTLEREYMQVYNSNVPEWGKVNYGNLDDYKTTVTDDNGVEGSKIGEAKAIMNMLENSKVESKVAPAPSGLTVNVLPGIQPNDKPLNSFVFSLAGSGGLMAPRNYYLSEVPVTSTYTDKGLVNKPLTAASTALAKTTNITVMQVPFSEDHFLTDTTGVTTQASKVSKANAEIKKSLNELRLLAKDNASHEKLSSHLFGSSGITTSYVNINTMINSGAYADAYQQGLGIALGTNTKGERSLPGVYIQTNNVKDVYAQFDHIYQGLINRTGSGYFSPALVDWAQKNATSITHTLMVNYMMQSQFKGTNGNYSTPISMNYWTKSGTEFSDFNKKVKTLGRQSKEPFYLYTVINPEVAKLKSGGSMPVFKSQDIQPHLAYIFNLYTAVHSQVWVGMTGINATGSVDSTWNAATKSMANKISSNKVKGDNIPYNANNTTYRWSEIEFNNLVSGLSTGKKKGSERYPNHELIGALRLMLSSGEHISGTTVKLSGKETQITPIGKTKYEKTFPYNHMYNSFASNSSEMFTRWEAYIKSAMKIPIQPLVLRSNWDKSSGEGAYIMLPVLLGSYAFPDSLGIMLENLAKAKEDKGGEDYLNMSHANRYVMTFNLQHSKETKTTNTTGVVRVDTGATIGVAKDKSKPIVITGYLGTDTFSITDYFLAQDALNAGQNKPPLKAPTVGGKNIQLDYFRLFEDFFTIRKIEDLTGSSDTEVSFIQGFQKDSYIQKYKDNSGKSYVKQFSPDYNKFFESKEPEAPINESGGN